MLTQIHSYKFWLIFKTRGRYEICWSWRFQNTPYMCNLIKIWLRYLRLKTHDWFVGDENNKYLNNLFQKLFCSPSQVPISTRIILKNTIKRSSLLKIWKFLNIHRTILGQIYYFPSVQWGRFIFDLKNNHPWKIHNFFFFEWILP